MRIRTSPTNYVTATRVRAMTGISDSILLRLVASGRLRVHIQPGFRPLYCVADVRKSVARLPVQRSGKRKRITETERRDR